MKIKSKLLFLLFIISWMNPSSLHSQVPQKNSSTSPLLPILRPTQPIHISSRYKACLVSTLVSTPTNPSLPNNLKKFMISPSIDTPSNLYYQTDLAFFCRLEVKMENKAKLPVKIRLGDVQYVDYLEGKFEPWRYGY